MISDTLVQLCWNFDLFFRTSPGDDGAGLLLKLSVDGSLVMSTFSEGRRLNLKSNTEEQFAAHTYIRGRKRKRAICILVYIF